jgi:hypothetical protein
MKRVIAVQRIFSLIGTYSGENTNQEAVQVSGVATNAQRMGNIVQNGQKEAELSNIITVLVEAVTSGRMNMKGLTKERKRTAHM